MRILFVVFGLLMFGLLIVLECLRRQWNKPFDYTMACSWLFFALWCYLVWWWPL